MLLPTVPKLKRDKAVLESNVDYEDEEEIEVGFTTTIQPIKSVKRTKSSSKKLDSIPTCQIQIAETLPVSVFDDKDLAPNHLPMHEVCNKFIRCFHQFVSRVFSTNFSQFKQLKKETNFLLVQNSFFSVCQLKKNNQQITVEY